MLALILSTYLFLSFGSEILELLSSSEYKFEVETNTEWLRIVHI